MAIEQRSIEEALTLLRERFQAHCQVGQEQFFGLRRRLVRRDRTRSLYTRIEWYNALGEHRAIGGQRGELIEVRRSDESEAFLALHSELAELRAARPRVLPRVSGAPEKVMLAKQAPAGRPETMTTGAAW